MKFFLILKYFRPYLHYLGLYIFFTFLSILFNVSSIGLIVPFLSLLFGTKELILERPPLTFNLDSLLDNFYYYISIIIQHYGTNSALIFICVSVIVLFLFKNLFRYLSQFFLAPIKSGVVRDITQQIYNKIIKLPLSFFTEKRKGDIISRMTTDVQEIEWAIMSSIEVIFRDPFTILAFLTAMFLMSYKLTLFVFILLPVSGIIIGQIGKSLRRTAVKSRQEMGFLLSIIEEMLSGLRIIKAFNAEDFNIRRFQKVNNHYRDLFTRVSRKRDLSAPLSEFLGIVVVCVIIWFGGRLVLGADNSLTPEFFIGYVVMFSQIISPSKAFSTAYYNIQRGMASLDRITSVLKAESKIVEKPDAMQIKEFNDKIVYENVCFSYPADGGTSEHEMVLKNINLEIKKGKTIAIVGESGAGKTTLADLLSRFYDVTQGNILIDGVSIKDYKIADLRRLMGIVTQEPILFNDTVFNNVAFGENHYTEEEVISAAKVANANDFIMEMKGGYYANIGDRGGKLSGGQKQRIAIARAILRNPSILLLDEATSSLDSESERLVQEALQKLMKNRTSIVIAHRLSTVQYADEIVVLHKGEIVEQGTHAELIEKKGFYRRLYDLQAFV